MNKTEETRNQIQKFIDDNLSSFENLDNREVIQYDLNEFNNNIVNYLKDNYRFDYKDICIYFVKSLDEIWVEHFV